MQRPWGPLIAIAINALLFSTGTLASGTCNSPDSKVLIFGAGISGVSAAKKLYDSGWTDFIILEGRDRVGGRMRSQSFAGVKVEVGANWIHGVDDTGSSKFRLNPIRELQQKAGLAVVNDLEALAVYGPNRIDATAQTEGAITNLDAYNDNVEALNIPGGAGDKSVRAALTSVGWLPSSEVDQFADWFGFDSDVGTRPNNVSSYGWSEESTFEDFGASNYLVVDQRGYEYLVQYLVQSFNSTARLRFNTTVNQIEYSDNCVCAKVLENGVAKQYCGNYGIVTFSIGVLQSRAVAFSPALPQWKVDAINKIVFPLYLKIFVQFNETFWDTNVNFIGRVTSNPENYTLFIPIGSLLPTRPNVLLCILTGNTALRVAQQSVDVTKTELYAALQTMYDFRAVIVDVLVPDWSSNALYYGAYSSPGVGISDQTYDNLAAPVQSLYFSGEATSEKYIGSVHGAYLAGIATAESITGSAVANVLSIPAVLVVLYTSVMLWN